MNLGLKGVYFFFSDDSTTTNVPNAIIRLSASNTVMGYTPFLGESALQISPP